MEQTYFRKGFGLKKELRPVIDAEYQSALVERIRALAPEKIVISPGPCTPNEAGVSLEALKVLPRYVPE